jgi:hypothetical protein
MCFQVNIFVISKASINCQKVNVEILRRKLYFQNFEIQDMIYNKTKNFNKSFMNFPQHFIEANILSLNTLELWGN